MAEYLLFSQADSRWRLQRAGDVHFVAYFPTREKALESVWKLASAQSIPTMLKIFDSTGRLMGAVFPPKIFRQP